MIRPSQSPLVSIALPVYNGGDTLAPVVESVLAQTHTNLELVISDNASIDDTQEICRQFARDDRRVVYLRQPRNVGLLNNFISAAENTAGTFVRWIGDDDSIEPDYVSRVLDVFAEDERRVVVTTQMVYRDDEGVETLNTDHDPSALSSQDPLERFSGMLRLLTTEFAALDPLYGMLRRGVATAPRRNMQREDQIFAARLALAGPWGHVPAPLARRGWHPETASDIARLLDVPEWRRHVRVLLQCRELSRWVARSSLDSAQQAQARVEILRFYARGKRDTALRGVAKLERMMGRSAGLSPSGAR